MAPLPAGIFPHPIGWVHRNSLGRATRRECGASSGVVFERGEPLDLGPDETGPPRLERILCGGSRGVAWFPTREPLAWSLVAFIGGSIEVVDNLVKPYRTRMRATGDYVSI